MSKYLLYTRNLCYIAYALLLMRQGGRLDPGPGSKNTLSGPGCFLYRTCQLLMCSVVEPWARVTIRCLCDAERVFHTVSSAMAYWRYLVQEACFA